MASILYPNLIIELARSSNAMSKSSFVFKDRVEWYSKPSNPSGIISNKSPKSAERTLIMW